MKNATIEEPTAPKGEVDDTELELEWQSLDWHSIEKQVSRMQTRISKATISNKHNDMERLSYLLTHSFYAKAWAVRTVCTNSGSKTPGVDGVLWLTDAQKMIAVKVLDPNHYKAQPLKRVMIPKKNGKMRPLGIPTMHDRAMQTLYQLALDPICEATSDPNSYGFRKGRCCQDAIEAIFKQMSRKNSPKIVLEGDIRGCYDHISHQWLMNNIPMDKGILRKFLKAGYVFEGGLFPTDEGTPQGGTISPTLANMTLNGMEPLVEEHFPGAHLTRYADDFVVVVPNEEMAHKVKELLTEFLAERGLELSLEKTLVTHIDDGFDFLGFNLRKYSGKMIIKPSKKSFQGIKEKLRSVILGYGKAVSQDELITRLNPAITGWCNYFNKVCSKKTFSALHNYLFLVLRQWAHRRHSRSNPNWVIGRYWHKVGVNEYVFSSDALKLVSPKEIPIRRHIKVKALANPYIDKEYFQARSRPGGKCKFETSAAPRQRSG
ncbi:MAG: group II intron reverse transcriptase/maturase [Candidatus Methanomethylophilaceae archaeon]|nr:group II intron reverse transcriptase/maturase [Candidatus Methanomethylophilaceae archaeon]